MNKQVFNPYLPSYEYVPDAEPKIFKNRLYVYGSHDRFNGNDFCLNDYVCWSAPLNNLADWKFEGCIYRAVQDPANKNGKNHMDAPDVVQGKDGRYYLYYQLNLLTITSVAVSESPTGPYEFYGYVQHEDGTPWGDKRKDAFAFDPGVLIDDDGRIYLYIGFAPVDLGFRMLMKMRGNNVDGGVCLELDQDMKTVIGGEYPVIPGHYFTDGTGFEGHGFYEASSPRKIRGKYYLVYSSELSHELCYAISDHPDRGFQFGGTLISIGDLGFNGRTQPDNYTGNTHGGMVQIGDQWYIFYHRQTNLQKCSRQGCAEKITINPDGSIKQVEMTSCGLNNGPLFGEGRYEARIACNLSSAEGTIPLVNTTERSAKKIHPYFTQSGADREENGDQFIANMRNGASAGFKYFNLNKLNAISVSVRGNAKGVMEVTTGSGAMIARIQVEPTQEYHVFTQKVNQDISGVEALYFTFLGSGALDFEWFELS